MAIIVSLPTNLLVPSRWLPNLFGLALFNTTEVETGLQCIWSNVRIDGLPLSRERDLYRRIGKDLAYSTAVNLSARFPLVSPGAAIRYRYRAAKADCQACPLKAHCCPHTSKGRALWRVEDSPAVTAFKQKMATPAAQQIYKQRAGVAEFPNAWIKEKIGLRQFRLRGLAKVGSEALWACLTYNIQQWIRLLWRPQQQRAQAAAA